MSTLFVTGQGLRRWRGKATGCQADQSDCVLANSVLRRWHSVLDRGASSGVRLQVLKDDFYCWPADSDRRGLQFWSVLIPSGGRCLLFWSMSDVCCSGVCLLSLMDTLTQCSARCSSNKDSVAHADYSWRQMYACSSKRVKTVLCDICDVCHRFWTTKVCTLWCFSMPQILTDPKSVLCGVTGVFRRSWTTQSRNLWSLI